MLSERAVKHIGNSRGKIMGKISKKVSMGAHPGHKQLTLRNNVQKLQNRAARVLTYSSYGVDTGHLFKLLGWINLACQQQIQRATMVYRSLHGLAPNYLSSKSERREVAYNLGNLKINSMFHYRAQTITKTASAIVAPFSGI